MDFFNNFIATLSAKFGQILPGLAGSIVMLVIGLLFAAGARKLTLLVFKRTGLDERINKNMRQDFKFDVFIARLVYFLVLVFVLLLVLDMLGIDGVLAPFTNMLNDFLSYLPKIVAAIVIGAAGWVIATLTSEASGFITTAVQSVTEKSGIQTTVDFGSLIRKLIFILVFIPVLVAALDALNMTVISDPAKNMINQFLGAIPDILAAAAILGVFYVVGKFIVSLLVELLSSLGLDKFSGDLGLNSIMHEGTKLSVLAGKVIFFFIMFGGIIAGCEKLFLPEFTDILRNIFDMAGKVLLGFGILLVGNYLANLAKNAVESSEENKWLGQITRFAVLFIFLALGLSTMGIGEDIVNLAFGITFGALGVAFAIAFGLGGKEAASKIWGKVADKF